MAWIFLDLDGTLTDPAEGIIGSLLYALEKMGQPRPDPAGLGWVIGPPLRDSFETLGVPDPEAAVAAYRERFATEGLFENRVYEGIPEAMHTLRAAGHSLALATSKPQIFARRITDHFGLAPMLSVQAGATLDGRLSSKTDILAHAIADTGADPALSVMVGDRSYDIDAARALGVASIGVRWGYGTGAELSAADAICDTPADLPQAVETLLAR